MGLVRKVLIGVVVIVVAVYGGLKGFLYYKYKTAMDQLVAQAALFADVKYGGIGSSLTGSIMVHDVEIVPHTLYDTVRVKTVRVDTPSLFYLMGVEDSLSRGELPDFFTVSLSGLRFETTGAVLRWFSSAAQAANTSANTSLCGGQAVLTPADLEKLGYKALISDLVMGYTYDKFADSVGLSMLWSFREMGGLEFELQMEGAPSAGMAMGLAEPPSLGNMAVAWRDDSYTQRAMQYCAELSGMSTDAYIDAWVNQGDDFYAPQWGGVPNTPLREAYRRFLKSPSEFRLTLSPSTPFQPQNAGLYGSDDLVAMLNPVFEVNGEVVTGASFTMVDQPAPAFVNTPLTPALPGSTDDAQGDSAADAGRAALRRKNFYPDPIRFETVSPGTLRSHIGRDVRIETLDSQLRRGELKGVTGSYITVHWRVHGGSMTAEIPLNKIRKAEVAIQ